MMAMRCQHTKEENKMRRSIEFEVNVLTDEDFSDIDLRNEIVDDTIDDYPWADDDKTATDIEYEVVKCAKDGTATIKATFVYD